MCGGTLIDQITVLTAAHCLIQSQFASYSVYLGLHDRNNLTNRTVVKKNATVAIGVCILISYNIRIKYIMSYFILLN